MYVTIVYALTRKKNMEQEKVNGVMKKWLETLKSNEELQTPSPSKPEEMLQGDRSFDSEAEGLLKDADDDTFLKGFKAEIGLENAIKFSLLSLAWVDARLERLATKS